jgi:hypothetical protein
MANNRKNIEELFLLALEANQSKSSEYELLKNVASDVQARPLRRRAESARTDTKSGMSFQDKLQLSYGL